MRASVSGLGFARPSPRRLWVTTIALAVVVFVSDLLTPLGVAMGAFYILVVLPTLWLPGARVTWGWAAACTALVGVGYVFSPPGPMREAALANRALSVVLLWVAAALANAKKQAANPFRLAVQQAPYAVVISDEEGHIAFANPEAERLLGYRERELEGQPVEILVPDRFRAGHPDERRRFIEEPRIRPMGTGRDLPALRKDGEEIPTQIGLTHFMTDRRRFVVATIIDVSERQRAERRISIQNEELRTLLHAVSHDLKEPLRGVESFARLLDEQSSPRLDEKGRELLFHVRKAAARLRTLLDDLLTLSRAQHGRAQTGAVDLGALTREAIERLRETVKETGARVELIGDFPSLSVDPRWTREAIVNLVSNSLKFTRTGEPADVEIEAIRDEDQPGLVVRDRGPGVGAGDAERIFQVFQRAHGRDVEGTGAGLAIVRAVAERHGGRTWVQPRIGGGSEFYLTFSPTPAEDSEDRRMTTVGSEHAD